MFKQKKKYYLMFDTDWFIKNQSWLIWLCNHPILKYWFRWTLRIYKDVSFKKYIFKILPNNYHWIDEKINKDKYIVKIDFRTHNKFSKRLYYSFAIIWWILHYWDIFFANRFIPEYNFGFDELTFRPDADSESTSVDGYACRKDVDEDFATIIAGAGNVSNSNFDYTRAGAIECSTTNNQFKRNWRGIFLFDTSSLPDDATIDSADFSLYVYYLYNYFGSEPGIEIVSSNPDSNTEIINADYGTLGSTSFSSASWADFSTSSYTDFTLNSSGLNNISKTGISKFGTMTDWDFDGSFGGSWSSGDSCGVGVRTADKTGETEDPKLVVTYTSGWSDEFIGASGFDEALKTDRSNIDKIIGV